MAGSSCFIAGLALSLLRASVAYAQASIVGVVVDPSGAVLPRVTVEAASPALIEKVRAVTTDGAGRYHVVDLRPGTYAVSFTLRGFKTFRRERIELSGSFSAVIDVELRVGAIDETVTVTGGIPGVDVQNSTVQRVLGKEVIEGIPTSRTAYSVGGLIAPVQSANSGGGADVGGTNAIAHVVLTAHGGRATDQRVMLDGLSTNNAEGSGNLSGFLINMGSAQEVDVEIGAETAERATGGVHLNVVPREGGNTFHGSFVASGTGGSFLQASNYTAALQAAGLPRPNAIQKIWDINPGMGGPIVRDRAWFYGSARWNGENTYAGGFGNLNAGDPNAWTYERDPGNPTLNMAQQRSINGRVTWQITSRNKLGGYYDDQYRCWCPRNVTPTVSAEAAQINEFPYSRIGSVTWSSPRSNRVFLDAGAQFHSERWTYPVRNPALIPVTDQESGLTYRNSTQGNGGGLFPRTLGEVMTARASASYITGTHAFKVGFADQHVLRSLNALDNDYNLSYRFNAGLPNQITQRSTPFTTTDVIKADLGIYVQDRWTAGRVTANLGLRFDYFNDYFPEQRLGTSQYTPDRNIAFAETPWVSWKDVTPRIGIAYDPFGNARTAIKASLNKYLSSFGLQGVFGDSSNPINLLATTVTRSWNDTDHDFIPDCNLAESRPNGECGAMSDLSFGRTKPSTTVDPAILRGWAKRAYNWEFSAGIQHELIPRVTLDVAYFRRSYGNFIAIDNQNTTADDYTAYTVTAPLDPRLPGGGGYKIGPLYDLNPGKVGSVNNYITFASNYGNQIERWNGVDISIGRRLERGSVVNGGISTGKTVASNCAVLARVPESVSTQTAFAQNVTVTTQPVTTPYCRQDSGFITQVKAFGSYTLPKIDLQTSANIQALPGTLLAANYLATNSVVAPSLGRPLSGGAANVTVNLVPPGAMYGDRLVQVDLRFAKRLRFGAPEATFTVDLYNVLNANPVLSVNANYAAWLQPLTVLQGRFARLGVRFDF